MYYDCFPHLMKRDTMSKKNIFEGTYMYNLLFIKQIILNE